MKAHGAGAGLLRVRVPVDVRGATIVTLLLHLVTTHAQGSTVAASPRRCETYEVVDAYALAL